MNDLEVIRNNLPATLPELSKFALVGREKLASVRAEIRAIQKVGLAKEVLEQKKAEAQEIAELVTLSEMQLGRMLKEIPKTSGGINQYNKDEKSTKGEKSKTETTEELGFSKNQVSQFQRMADHEDIVHEVIAEARENDDIVSRAAVLDKIREREAEQREEPKPHVAFNSGNNEWYTPKDIIDAALKTMGSIDIDPASSEMANKVVNAAEYYTAETNGLDKKLHGNVWLNPPYSADLIGKFIQKLVDERKDYKQAIVLVNNATETAWFSNLISVASAVCFPRSRIQYYMPDGKHGSPLQGQAIVYIGESMSSFINSFGSIGWIGLVYGVRKQ